MKLKNSLAAPSQVVDGLFMVVRVDECGAGSSEI